MTGRRWEDHAECFRRGIDPEAYFPEWGALIDAEALRACYACPVRIPCLRLGQATDKITIAMGGHRYGIWGGLTPRQRASLARGASVLLLTASRRNRKRRSQRDAAKKASPGRSIRSQKAQTGRAGNAPGVSAGRERMVPALPAGRTRRAAGEGA